MSQPDSFEARPPTVLPNDVLEIDRKAEPDRYRCPRGHTNWALGYGGMVHCWACEERGGRCNYNTLRDARRHVELPADRVAIVAGSRRLSERWREE